MLLLPLVLLSAAILLIAYHVYGAWLAKALKLDANVETPAVRLRDDVDYAPIAPRFLISQHFSAIAAAGPIVGPILAGVMFGWLPALIWILVGSIFIGGVHDFTALTASIRHKARSIAEIVREHMNRRSYILFLIFIWIAMVYIVVAFTDIVASSFVGRQVLENGQTVSGGGIATASLLYLALPLLMGLLMRYARLPLGLATLIFVPLVGVAIWLGPRMPLDLAALLNVSDAQAAKIWDVALLGYCFVASMAPIWLLLQPRGHLGGYFLYVAVIGSFVGIVLGGHTVQYPAFIGWSSARGETLFPVLFITIACGACSGFHAIVASGTTSKQLRRETDARVVGYGTMLLEAMVAVISLACVMMLAPGSAVLGGGAPKPNFIYGQGLGNFLSTFGVPAHFAASFALLAFTTFVYDTLDVCTRLGRYILQEIGGWQGKRGRWIATAITVATPLVFVLQKTVDAAGNAVPAWRVFWPLFGASNQLLAALTLIGVTVWLYRTTRARWVWFVTGLPALWMYAMSSWALLSFIRKGFTDANGNLAGLPTNAVPWAALVLLALAVILFVEALRALRSPSRKTPPPEAIPEPA